MSREQEDALVGKLHRQRKEAKEKLARLMAEASGIGVQLSQLGQVLGENPQHVSIDGQPMEARYATRHDFSSSTVNPDRIKALTADIRDTDIELQKITEQLRQMLFDV